MGIPENIDALLVKFDITQDHLARIAGVTPAAISGWRRGSMPRRKNVQAVCDYFKLSEDDIFSDAAGLAAKEHGTYRAPNALDVVAMPMVRVPLLGYVHAGKPETAEEYEYESIEIPEFLLNSDPDCYALKAEGDCMDKVYPEGCTIVVSPNKEPVNGSVAVVRINDTDTVMRRMYRTPYTLVLSPDSYNPEHTDIVITSDSETTVEFLGKVVWFQSREEME